MRDRALLLLFAASIFASTGLRSLAPSTRILHFEISMSKDTELAKEAMLALSSIFAKHGYTIIFDELPLPRGLEELRKGRLDGSAGRASETDVLYGITQYKKLTVPITYSTLTMWCHKSYATLPASRRIKIGYLRGSITSSRLIRAVDKKTVTAIPLNSFRGAAVMLMNGRLDCMLAFRWTFEDDLKGAFDLTSFVSHHLIRHAFYPWISAALLPLKKQLEDDLRAYSFPPAWTRKYRSNDSICNEALDTICPDGIVFKKGAKL